LQPAQRGMEWHIIEPSDRREEVGVGLTELELEVANPASPEVIEKVTFLIDSGAVYSVVPTPVLERLGIKPMVEEEFRLANGYKIVRKKGGAVFRYGKRVGFADVIFGEAEDSTLLGALTLEALGLSLDPLRRVKDRLDGSLSFRWSCRMGVCGSCSMMVNGVPRLTCAAFLKDFLPGPIRVEPLRYFPVLRDLVVEIGDFMHKLKRVKP